MRCLGRVANKWWHIRDGVAKEGTLDHQCEFRATAGNYCGRHSPRRAVRILARRKSKLEADLARCMASLEEARALLPEESEAVIHSPS